jgi:hypothetical protein
MGRSNNAKNERPQTRHFDAKKSNANWSRISPPSRIEHRATAKGRAQLLDEERQSIRGQNARQHTDKRINMPQQ